MKLGSSQEDQSPRKYTCSSSEKYNHLFISLESYYTEIPATKAILDEKYNQLFQTKEGSYAVVVVFPLQPSFPPKY